MGAVRAILVALGATLSVAVYAQDDVQPETTPDLPTTPKLLEAFLGVVDDAERLAAFIDGLTVEQRYQVAVAFNEAADANLKVVRELELTARYRELLHDQLHGSPVANDAGVERIPYWMCRPGCSTGMARCTEKVGGIDDGCRNVAMSYQQLCATRKGLVYCSSRYLANLAFCTNQHNRNVGRCAGGMDSCDLCCRELTSVDANCPRYFDHLNHESDLPPHR